MSTKNINNNSLQMVKKPKNCIHHKLTRTANPIKEFVVKGDELELIQVWDCRHGDSNDVLDSNDVRATRSQIYAYAKSYFKPRYWNDLNDDSDGESVLLSIYENEHNTLYVDCYPQGNEFNSWHIFRDLIRDWDFDRTEPK